MNYNLKAFAFIEEHLNCINEAIKLFNKKDIRAVAIILQAGLLCEKVDVYKLSKKTNFEELMQIIAKALSEATCVNYGFDKEFDWALLYFIAKPALNFSDEEFWNSTPKKILTMMKMLEETKKGKQSEEALTGEDAVKEVMEW